MKRKGSALIIAIMLILLFTIFISGLCTVSRVNLDLATARENKQELFWMAEGGMNALFSQYAKEHAKVTPSFQSLNGVLPNYQGTGVALNYKYVPAFGGRGDSLEVKATKNGKSCFVRLGNLQPTSIIEFGAVMTGDMKGTTSLYGTMTGETHDANTDHFICKTYFAGRLQMDAFPWFEGKVVSSSNTDSKYYKWGHTNPENATGLEQTKYLTNKNGDGLLGDDTYAKGIYDGSADDFTNESKEHMQARYETIFTASEGFSHRDDPIPFEPGDVIKSWTDISVNKIDYTPQNNSSVQITFTDDKKVTIKEKGYAKKEFDVSNSNGNVVRITGSPSKVVINESVIASDVTLIVEAADTYINGDIYYKGLDNCNGTDYTTLTHQDINTTNTAGKTPIVQLRDIIAAGDYPKFGLVNKLGSILTDKNMGADAVDGNDDALLIMGAYYAPNGQFGANKIGGSISSSYDGTLQTINIGSIIMKKKGVFKSNNNGLSVQFNSDLRFERGQMPPGFKEAAIDVTHQFGNTYYRKFAASAMTWSVDWE